MTMNITKKKKKKKKDYLTEASVAFLKCSKIAPCQECQPPRLLFTFIFFHLLYLHMYLHYTYFLHDAYTTLTCTTYNTYITIQLH